MPYVPRASLYYFGGVSNNTKVWADFLIGKYLIEKASALQSAFDQRRSLSGVTQVSEVCHVPLPGRFGQKICHSLDLACRISSQYHIIVVSVNRRELKLAYR